MRPTLFCVLALAAACQPRSILTSTTKDEDGGGGGGGGDDTTTSDSTTDYSYVTDTSTTVQLGDCPAEPDPVGPWDAHPIIEAGATWTYDPYPFDGGVQAVYDAASTSTSTGSTDPAEVVSIPVTKAIVTSVGFRPDSGATFVEFWFEDANASMDAYNVDVPSDVIYQIVPGAEVAFTVTGVKNFAGEAPEVTEVTDLQVLSSGNAVHIVDVMGSGDPLSSATQGLHTVEVWGQLVSGPTDCSSNCWDLEYGGHTVTFRSDSTFDYLGDCVHYIGPLGSFGGSPQLDAKNFDWYWRF